MRMHLQPHFHPERGDERVGGWGGGGDRQGSWWVRYFKVRSKDVLCEPISAGRGEGWGWGRE